MTLHLLKHILRVTSYCVYVLPTHLVALQYLTLLLDFGSQAIGATSPRGSETQMCQGTQPPLCFWLTHQRLQMCENPAPVPQSG